MPFTNIIQCLVGFMPTLNCQQRVMFCAPHEAEPAAHIFMGSFFGESLILAETGYVNKAIQIGGTAEITQLPFFIAACDYTLIGEEFFAASAYLSQDPSLLSTIRAADWAKTALVLALLTGAVLESLGHPAFRAWFRIQ